MTEAAYLTLALIGVAAVVILATEAIRKLVAWLLDPRPATISDMAAIMNSCSSPPHERNANKQESASTRPSTPANTAAPTKVPSPAGNEKC